MASLGYIVHIHRRFGFLLAFYIQFCFAWTIISSSATVCLFVIFVWCIILEYKTTRSADELSSNATSNRFSKCAFSSFNDPYTKLTSKSISIVFNYLSFIEEEKNISEPEIRNRNRHFKFNLSTNEYMLPMNDKAEYFSFR